jgi:hypothetical protein
MGMELELQEAIFQNLSGDAPLLALVNGIYDYVPQPNDAGSPANFPYVVVGDDSLNAWDTDTTTGADSSIVIHSWSRYKGKKEIKQIQGAVYAALNRATLSIDGYSFVTCDLLTSDSFIDSDGITQHSTQTFRVLFNTA